MAKGGIRRILRDQFTKPSPAPHEWAPYEGRYADRTAMKGNTMADHATSSFEEREAMRRTQLAEAQGMTATIAPVRGAGSAFESRLIAPKKVDTSALEAEVRSVSSTGAEKGVKASRFSLIPPGPLKELAEHYGVGAEKYDEHNWAKGYEWSKSIDSLTRHLNAFQSGEDRDPETGSKHMTAVAWHAFTLVAFMDIHPEFDDRLSTLMKEARDAE